MTTVRVNIFDNEIVPVDSVIEKLTLAFPGTMIAAEDSFEAEESRVHSAIAELLSEGTAITSPDLLIHSIRSKKAALGPGKDIIVPITAALTLEGHVWAKDIVLCSSKPLAAAHITLVTEVLQDLHLGSVAVYH